MYDSDNFIQKNRNTQTTLLNEALEKSTLKLVRGLAVGEAPTSGDGKVGCGPRRDTVYTSMREFSLLIHSLVFFFLWFSDVSPANIEWCQDTAVAWPAVQGPTY